MAKVTFWRTTGDMKNPQEEIGTITLEGSTLSIAPNVKVYADALLADVDRKDGKAVLAALKQANRMFTGSYLRAGFEG